MGTTELHGKHRLGGKHSDPIGMDMPRESHGARHSARQLPVVPPSPIQHPKVPPPPTRQPMRATDSPANIAALSLAPITESIPVITEVEPVTIRPWSYRGKAVAVAIAASGLVIGTGTIAAINPQRQAQTAQRTTEISPPPTITAPPDAVVDYPSVHVETEPAPPPPPPVFIPKPPIVKAPVAPPNVIPAPVVAQPAPPPPPPPPATSNKAARIASAALAQIGIYQDCTMLVTNALRTVGINFHDWPVGYLSLGHTISAAEAIPGDLLYYVNGGAGVAHIAVYIGNGQAVHGGFNGNETRIWSANVGSGPIFIRVH